MTITCGRRSVSPSQCLNIPRRLTFTRAQFDEYISGALSSVKYHDFLAKGQNAGVAIADGAGNPNAVQDFNMLWIQEFKQTNAYEVWNRITDSMLFDIVEPRYVHRRFGMMGKLIGW